MIINAINAKGKWYGYLIKNGKIIFETTVGFAEKTKALAAVNTFLTMAMKAGVI